MRFRLAAALLRTAVVVTAIATTAAAGGAGSTARAQADEPPAPAEADPAPGGQPAWDPNVDLSCPRRQVYLNNQWLSLSITGGASRSVEIVGTESLRRWLRRSTWKIRPFPFEAFADAPVTDRDEVIAALQVRGGWLVGVNQPALGGGVAYYSREGDRYAVLETRGIDRVAAVGEGAVVTVTRFETMTGSGEAVFLHPDPSGRWQIGPTLDLPGAPVYMASGRHNVVLLKYDVPVETDGRTVVTRIGQAFLVSAEAGFQEQPCR